MGILDKIAEIEKEIARTQKNKGKEHAIIYIEFLICKGDETFLGPGT
jgi:ribosome-interacting GTPase 1